MGLCCLVGDIGYRSLPGVLGKYTYGDFSMKNVTASYNLFFIPVVTLV